MNMQIIRENFKQLNWKNVAFRLWIVLSICWEFIVVFVLLDKGPHLSILVASIWPFLLLLAVVFVAKLGKWIFDGLHEKDGRIDVYITKLINALTFRNMLFHAKKICAFVTSVTSKFRKQIGLTLGILVILIGTLIYIKTSFISAPTFQLVEKSKQPSKNMSMYEVSAPDGTLLYIEGPKDASDEDVISQAKRLYIPRSTLTTPYPMIKEPKELRELGEPKEPAN
jgi:hypothetical protein